MLIRLQKYIADLGICSRRKAEGLIRDGKVTVNGKSVREMGIKVDPELDTVFVSVDQTSDYSLSRLARRGLQSNHKKRSTEVPRPKSKIYIALNKPINYITSASSIQGESVLDLIDKKKVMARVYPVGRLDKDSEGLVLLTNDGELTNLLTHPRHEHEKEYEVTIDQPLSKDAKNVLTNGMKIDEDFLKGIDIIKESNRGKRSIITVVLKEGKNRQIRKMFGRLGYHVISLKRTRMGKLKLGAISPGKWRFVKKDQIV